MPPLKNHHHTGQIILTLWIVFSLAYILYDQWVDFKVSAVDAAYQAGVTDAAAALVKGSATCEPITVTDGQSQVQLISVSCLQEGSETEEE